MGDWLIPVIGIPAVIAAGIIGACIGSGIAWLVVHAEDRLRAWRRR